jgi:4-amino-4-deoxy-L-arabinose transferase-like glycosyltransferase
MSTARVGGHSQRPSDTVRPVTTPRRVAASDKVHNGRMFRGLAASPLAWCCTLVALEAIVILVGLGVDNVQILGGDGPTYSRLAHNLLSHGAYSLQASAPFTPTVSEPPGYPVVLAILDFVAIHLSIGQLLTVRICQFAMVAATACLVYAIGRELDDEFTARVAGLLTASYLPLLDLAGYHLTEITTCLLCTLVVLLLVRLLRRPSGSLVSVCGLGLAISAATYVRPDFTPLVVIAAAALLLAGKGSFRSHGRWLRPGIVVGIFILTVVPWTIRNYDLTQHLIPVAVDSGGSLFVSAEQYAGTISYAMNPSDFDTINRLASRISATVHGNPGPKHEVAVDAALTRAAKRIFDRLSFTTIVKSIPKREIYLWQPIVFPPAKGRAVINALGWAQYLVLVVLALVGAAVSRRRHTLLRDWPLWMLAVYLTLLHLFFHIEGRYSVEARPALIVFAAIGGVALWRQMWPRMAPTFAKVSEAQPAEAS